MEEEEIGGVYEENATETEFEFNKFTMAFASPRVIQAYGLLLTLYKTNTVHTNHCIIKMLHRLTVAVSQGIYTISDKMQ